MALSFSSALISRSSMTASPPKRKYGETRKMCFQDGVKAQGRVSLKTHTPDCPIMKGTMSPRMKCPCDGEYSEGRNTVLLVGLQTIADHLVSSVNDAMIRFFEIGLDNTAPTNTDTDTLLVKARKNVVYAFRDTTNAVFQTFFNGNEANTNSGTVAIGTSTTQFTLAAGQGSLFAIGQLIKISGGAFGSPENRRIANLVGNTVTVTPAFSTTPSGGETVEQLLCEMVLYGGSAAGAALGSGVAFARTIDFTPRTKTATFGLTSEWRLTLT